MRTSSLTRPRVLAAVVVVVGALGATLPMAASASPTRSAVTRPSPDVAHRARPVAAVHRPALPAGQRYVCPAATPGQMSCMSIIAARPHNARGWAVPAAASNSYGPSDLRSAYKVATQAARNGRGTLVAIVDAFRDPNLASNLATYRKHFHLSACTTRSGCLKIVNQSGRTSPLPPANADWAVEESLDVDMVSAICPKCHILLVEARTPSTNDLGAAENTAIRKGARYVSNSWSGGEFPGQDFFNSDFNHPGDVVDFASGDFGYGPAYPTDLQYVTAIGGTSLRHARNRRGWSESVWGTSDSQLTLDGTGGGCSSLEPKPAWQRADASAPNGCLLRTENDVSAVGDPATGVLVYDTYREPGLFEVGGTSAATPIVTAIYALAGTPTRGSYPAEYPYLHARNLFDVTSGTNGKCEKFRQYLCHGERGYDSPTGLGTPNGTGAFTDRSAHRVTLVDPGTQDLPAHARFSLTITGLDTRRVSSLRWSATGLPAGLSIRAVSRSTNGRITGTLPAAAHTYHVAVTGKDGTVSSTTHFNIVAAPSMTGSGLPAAPIVLTSNGLCLDGGNGTPGQPVKLQGCDSLISQNWTYRANGGPDSTGTVRIEDQCLSLNGTHAVLANCTGALAEQWFYLGFGGLFNPKAGGCLAVSPQSAGTQAGLDSCLFGNSDTWNLPAGPIITGAGSLCLNNLSGTHVQVSTCAYNSQPTQLWTLEGNGQITNNSGECLTTNGLFSATAVFTEACDPTGQTFSQLWETSNGGQLINIASGRCLADNNNGGPGTVVVQNDCYGDLGELWGLN